MCGFADFQKIFVDFFGLLARCRRTFGVIHPSGRFDQEHIMACYTAHNHQVLRRKIFFFYSN